MRRFQQILGMVLVGLLTSCGKNPYSVKIPINPKEWSDSSKLLSALEKLPPKERAVVADHLNKYPNIKFYSGPSTIGELVEELAERQRISDERSASYERELRLEAAQKEREREEQKEKNRLDSEKRQKMSQILKAEIISSEIRLGSEENPDPFFSKTQFAYLNIAFDNTSNTDLALASGELDLKDKFGRWITSVELSLEFELPAGSSQIVRTTLMGSLANPSNLNGLRSTEDVSAIWVPHVFILKDGTSLIHPESPHFYETRYTVITEPLK